MIPGGWLSEKVSIRDRTSVRGDYGNEHGWGDWEGPFPAYVEQLPNESANAEQTVGRDTTEVRWRAFLRASTEIDALSQIRWERTGDVFDVDGEPAPFIDPIFGGSNHTEVRMTRLVNR